MTHRYHNRYALQVEFRSFYDVLRTINPSPGQVFYDLGSGTGKALFVARLTQDFSRCIGIEILEGLHQQAERNLDRFEKSYPAKQGAGDGQRVEVYQGSFLNFDWSDGDVVFANSTCFEDELMRQLTYAAERLKPGAIVGTSDASS
jgi:SAM-dependent methyltransferase